MLLKIGPEDMDRMISKCDEVARILREVKGNMIHPGPMEIEINALKAENYLVHLVAWANRLKTKHRQHWIEKDVKRVRDEIEKRRTAASGKKK